MPRVAIGGLHHETNSFAPQPATFERFLEAHGWPPLSRGEAMLGNVAGANLAITGFVEAAQAAGHALSPLVWANACPSGPVTRDAFERLAEMLMADLAKAGPVDGLFLDLHGAMVTEHLEDGEGELLRRLRQRWPELPIVAALDLHANVSDAMVTACDAMVAYRTYPHVDLAATGARALQLLERLLSGRSLAKSFRKLDFLVPLPWQCTTIEPARSLYALLDQVEAAGAVSASICMGFPAADTPVCGPTVLAYGETTSDAEAVAERLATAFAAAEPGFAGTLWQPEAAVRHAQAQPPGRPVILADTQDNPGGGGTADTTGLLEALLAAHAEGALVALLADPATAAAAHGMGVGGVLRDHPLGGRHGPDGVRPLIADFAVLKLGDGRFTATGPMYRGNRMDLGPMALLRPLAAPGVEIAVSSRRLQAADRSILAHLGVDAASKRILALKSSVHFRADFEAMAAEVLVVAAPGAVVADPSRLPFRRLRPGLRLSPRLS
jgi:microcystin degradation protein MlrC